MIIFHRVLIGTAIVFFGVFAIWSLVAFRQNGSTLSLVLGLFFVLATLGLGYYLKNLRRFLGR